MNKYLFKGDSKLEKSLVEAGILLPVYEDTKPEPSPVVAPDKFMYCGTFSKGDLYISYTVYNNAVSITLYEELPHKAIVGRKIKETNKHPKTLYSQNFYECRDLALKEVDDVLRDDGDAEDLIFKLKELKEEEIEANG